MTFCKPLSEAWSLATARPSRRASAPLAVALALVLSACATQDLPPWPEANQPPPPVLLPARQIAPVPPRLDGVETAPVPNASPADRVETLRPDATAPAPFVSGSNAIDTAGGETLITEPAAQPDATQCDAAPAQFAIGQPYSPQLLAQVRDRTHARGVRVLSPGQVTTREFIALRANLVLDETGKVAAVHCG